LAGQIVLVGGVGLAGIGLSPGWTGDLRLAAAVIGVGLAIGGLFLGARGLADLGSALSPFPAPVRDSVLVDSGVFGRIRHPIYAALILGSIGWGLAWASPAALAASAVLTVWLDLKARREEAWLLEAHPGYAAYRRRTRRFMPGLY
jgi:protein-S-isoprenylcysteine O-methyltransferase Ste14